MCWRQRPAPRESWLSLLQRVCELVGVSKHRSLEISTVGAPTPWRSGTAASQPPAPTANTSRHSYPGGDHRQAPVRVCAHQLSPYVCQGSLTLITHLWVLVVLFTVIM